MHRVLIIIIISLCFNYNALSQCSSFPFSSNNWSISAEGNAGTILFTDFGQGWEYTYGAGIEWAPFSKVLYFNINGRHVHQLTKDNSPDANIFVTQPNEVKMHSNLFRLQFGMKIRLDWFFNLIDDEGIHPFILMSYMHDQLLKEKTELIYDNYSNISNEKYSDKQLGGVQYELGISWVFNDNIKWDISGYIFSQKKYYSILKNGFTDHPNFKIGIGVNTGLFITF